MRAIAARLGRSASSVSREIGRNGGPRNYRATKADERAWDRARRPKRCLLAQNDRLRDVVAKKLKDDWSPQQISGWLVSHYYLTTVDKGNKLPSDNDTKLMERSGSEEEV